MVTLSTVSVLVKLVVITLPALASEVVALLESSEVRDTTGAAVSTAWASKLVRSALAIALPAVSVKPVPTKLNAIFPLATPAVGVTTTV